MKTLKARVNFDGGDYKLTIMVSAPKETANLILQDIYRRLQKQGVLV